MGASPRYSLDDKYLADHGTIALSGVQALVRLPIDQHKADRRAGLTTATLISGYRGSPLGGFDFLLQANQRLLAEHRVRFLPGVNEDLGATAIFGSQLANLFPGNKYDGVLGIWYGKGPGVDRSGDAFKHANLTGVGKQGGVLAIAGDDPASKSSTVPSASEVALFDAQMPVLFPADVQDVLDLGSAGFALSRYSGLWVGFKMTTNVADEFSSAEVGEDRWRWQRPGFEFRGKPWQPTQSHNLFAPYNLQTEQEVWEGRLEAARLFSTANRLNRTTVDPSSGWLGVVAAGKTYLDVREAFSRLGLSEEDLARFGIRLYRVGMLYPLEPGSIRHFARGLEEVLVVEEKRSFLELLVKDALYSLTDRPRVVGKQDEHGKTLVAGHGELDADGIAPILAARLSQRLAGEEMLARLDRLRSTVPGSLTALGPAGQRLSFFCSGCPHNRSTVVPEGSIAAAGIGCHGMAVTMDRVGTGFTQMGGEGAQWVGASFFTETPHLFQNLGDGTLFHSGSLAIRQAISAGVNLTYKILFNGAVAMTGGQQVDGGLTIPNLTRELAAEGIQRTLVLTDEVHRYDGVHLAPGVEVWSRDRLDEAQRILRDIPGVTALIYDQHCAADLRRQRKRGKAPIRPKRIFVNERICEGCGDCGVKSNCLSVLPVDTEFGRKTQIHQSSCNTDYSCLDGDCPSFVSVVPDPSATKKTARVASNLPGTDLPAPILLVQPERTNLYFMGIGGTGVVTVNQILATAAVLEGKTVRCLDQTGLSQKGGAVVSHLKILTTREEASNKIGVGDADGYIGFDVLTASDPRHLNRVRAGHTVAVVSSSHVPTGLMVRNPGVAFPEDATLHQRIDSVTRAADNVYLDAEGMAEFLFGSHLPANLIVVGAAFQRGLIPLSPDSVEHAIALNGTSVDVNVQAFRAGRKAVADPGWIASLEVTRAGALAVTDRPLAPAERSLIDAIGATDELRRLLEIRVPDLAGYQNLGYAADYVAFVGEVLTRERTLGQGTPVTEAVARYLHKLMAYKDEYEVARLSLDAPFTAALADSFGPGAAFKFELHPPVLRALGVKRKIGFGPWFRPVLALLRVMRRLRGTPFDVFGYDGIRRLERSLITEYRDLISRELASMTKENHGRLVRLAQLPDLIRGFENIKRRNVAKYREAVREHLAATSDLAINEMAGR